MDHKNSKLKKSCRKELAYILKKEAAIRRQAEKKPAEWKSALAKKIPDKVTGSLQTAFGKAFSIIFEKGTAIISKIYNEDDLDQNHKIQDYTIRIKGSRRELKRMRKMAEKSNLVNTALTTAEGAGLGLLGIGMPDIVVFTGVLLRGAYECAMQYGYDYNQPRERYLILCMMEAALSRRDKWVMANGEVNRLLSADCSPTDMELVDQIKHTSDAFAMDMLLLKFVQGLPLIGIIGGLGNPVYYNKIVGYIRLKYYKRYLLGLLNMN